MLNVVAVPLIAVWVGIPLLLVFVPATLVRELPPDHAGRIPRRADPPPVQEAAGARVLMWLRTTLTDPATWRDIVWLLVNAVLGFTLAC